MEESQREKNLKLIQKEKQIKTMIENLFSELNHYTAEKELAGKFLEHLKGEHPTLQQSFFRMIVEIIEAYPTEMFYFDARNQGAKEFCLLVNKMRKDIYLPLI